MKPIKKEQKLKGKQACFFIFLQMVHWLSSFYICLQRFYGLPQEHKHIKHNIYIQFVKLKVFVCFEALWVYKNILYNLCAPS